MADKKMAPIESVDDFTLKKTLGAFELGHLQSTLRTVPDAGELLSGMYGRILMAQWQLDSKEKGYNAQAYAEDALKALQTLAELKDAFDKAYDATDRSKPKLRRLIEAMYDALRASPPGPFEYKISSNPHASLLEKKIDCDLVSYLLIQFAENTGFRLIGASVTTQSGEGHYAALTLGLDGKPSLFIDTVLLIPTPKLPNTAEVREFVLQKTLTTPEDFGAFYNEIDIQDPRGGDTGWEVQNHLQKMAQNMENRTGPKKRNTETFGADYLKDMTEIVNKSAAEGDEEARKLFEKKRSNYEKEFKKAADFKSYYLYCKFMIKMQDLYPEFVKDADLFNLRADGIQRFGMGKIEDLFGN